MSRSHDDGPPSLSLNADDHRIISQVESSLRRAVQMRAWWDAKRRSGGFQHEFQLIRSFNKADAGYGFYDVFPEDEIPVMGAIADESFDEPKSVDDSHFVDKSHWQAEIREFILRYFLRVSDFREPDVFVDQERFPRSPVLRGFSWCPEEQDARGGFGFSQLYFKRRDTGEIGMFPQQDRFAIIDARELVDTYEWVVLKVKIFDFVIALSPPARVNPIRAIGAHLGFPLDEETLVVISRDFVADQYQPCPGVAGRYGFGYAILDQLSEDGLLAYGPGHFQSGFQLFTFDVDDVTGKIRARRVFVVNRPDRILNVPIDPLSISLRIVDTFSLGIASGVLGEQTCWANRVTVDPILPAINLLNVMTGGISGRNFCISKEQLEIIFLQQHFKQNYELIVGALRTWRQGGDWLHAPDHASLTLPEVIA